MTNKHRHLTERELLALELMDPQEVQFVLKDCAHCKRRASKLKKLLKSDFEMFYQSIYTTKAQPA